MKIAICQYESRDRSVEESLAAMRDAARVARAQGAGLVIFPEMFLTGYNIGDAVSRVAEPADGPAFQKAVAIAREEGVALLYGYPERERDTFYNSALLIDRRGKRVANYRKTHLYGTEENLRFEKGDVLGLVDLDGLRIGILICYDVEFPEAVRALALAGAELVAVPTALMEPYGLVARAVVPARAYENQLYVAYANLCGREGDLTYCGLSCIIGPDGEELVRAEGAGALRVADIRPETVVAVRKNNPILEGRRPELYVAPVRGFFASPSP